MYSLERLKSWYYGIIVSYCLLLYNILQPDSDLVGGAIDVTGLNLKESITVQCNADDKVHTFTNQIRRISGVVVESIDYHNPERSNNVTLSLINILFMLDAIQGIKFVNAAFFAFQALYRDNCQSFLLHIPNCKMSLPDNTQVTTPVTVWYQ